MPLGILPEAKYSAAQMHMEQDALLVFVRDTVTIIA